MKENNKQQGNYFPKKVVNFKKRLYTFGARGEWEKLKYLLSKIYIV